MSGKDNPPKYITQLTASDLREIFAAANPTPGFLIQIEKNQGDLKISVNEDALKIGIINLLQNLGVALPAGLTTEDVYNASMSV